MSSPTIRCETMLFDALELLQKKPYAFFWCDGFTCRELSGIRVADRLIVRRPGRYHQLCLAPRTIHTPRCGTLRACRLIMS